MAKIDQRQSVIDKLMLTVLQYNYHCLPEYQSEGDNDFMDDENQSDYSQEDDKDTSHLDAVQVKLCKLISRLDEYMHDVDRDDTDELSRLNQKIDAFRQKYHQKFCKKPIPTAMEETYTELVKRFVRLEEQVTKRCFIHTNVDLRCKLYKFLKKIVLNQFDFQSAAADLVPIDNDKQLQVFLRAAETEEEEAVETNAQGFYNLARQFCKTSIKFRNYYRLYPYDDEARDIERRLKQLADEMAHFRAVSMYRRLPDLMGILNSIRRWKAFDLHSVDWEEYSKCLKCMEEYRKLVLAMKNVTDEQDYLCPDFCFINVNWRPFIYDFHLKYLDERFSIMCEMSEQSYEAEQRQWL